MKRSGGKPKPPEAPPGLVAELEALAGEMIADARLAQGEAKVTAGRGAAVIVDAARKIRTAEDRRVTELTEDQVDAFVSRLTPAERRRKLREWERFDNKPSGLA